MVDEIETPAGIEILVPAEIEIPTEVLTDYQKRTIVSVANLHWANAEHTLLDCDAKFAELEALGAVPFTTMPDADTKHGREIWEAANAASTALSPSMSRRRAGSGFHARTFGAPDQACVFQYRRERGGGRRRLD